MRLQLPQPALAALSTLMLLAVFIAAEASSASANERRTNQVNDVVRSQVLQDLRATQPDRCYYVSSPISSVKWVSVSTSGYSIHHPECTPYDGYSIYKKVRGRWRYAHIGGSSVDCPNLIKYLNKAGAPKAVIEDFVADRYCYWP